MVEELDQRVHDDRLGDRRFPVRGEPQVCQAGVLREKFGDRARLVTVDDSGHGVYVLGDNSCALNTATRYLVEGEMPAEDTFCRAD